MEGDSGKLFIGGISWDTNEEQLTEYFSQFGEVAEAVIMRDRVTGRARGFGFIVFSDPAVAEQVTLEKHMIDGRLVEAKKAVPRDDQSPVVPKTPNTILSSPSPGPTGRTRKIFVGGLPSSITEPDFKLYFEQFGPISDVVVMYDHTTQRPRGFGFITFDSEEAVDRVLTKNTFHELNGKLVEVKRAVPKEISAISPGSGSRASPVNGFGLTRVGGLFNGYGYGTGPGPIGRYGLDGRYGVGSGVDAGVGVGMGIGTGFNASPGFGRGLGLYGGNNNNNRYGVSVGVNNSGVGYGGLGLNDDSRSVFMRNLLANGTGTGTGNPNSYFNMNMNMNNMGRNMGAFDNGLSGNNGGGGSGGGLNWMGPVGRESGFNSGNVTNGFGLVGGPSGGYGRNDRVDAGNGSFDNGYGVRNSNPDMFGADPIYGDKTWSFNTSELDAPGPFSYMDNYANNETSRGISS